MDYKAKQCFNNYSSKTRFFKKYVNYITKCWNMKRAESHTEFLILHSQANIY